MAYTDEALKAKLSTLNETQDSIVSVSQWITFHKRHADKISSYWLTRLRDAPPPKRLNFIYLVNDIVQNARARKRPEFPDAFAPLMPEAVATAYRSSTPEIQHKIRRVVEVWRGRSVWEAGIQSAIEARLDDVDKTKSSSGKKTLGGSLFNTSGGGGGGGGVPTELSTLPPLQVAVTKATLATTPAVATAQTEYNKLNDPDTVLPSPPVHAARLSSLMKALATAESSLNASIKARQSLIAEFEQILSSNKTALENEEATLSDLNAKRVDTENKKREVEDGIMRGLTVDSVTDDYDPTQDNSLTTGDGSGNNNSRPEVEELTPEPESFTPPVTDYVQTQSVSFSGNENSDLDALPLEAGMPDNGYNPQAPASIHDNDHQYPDPRLQGLLAGFSSTDDNGTTHNQLDMLDNTNILAGRVRQASGSAEPTLSSAAATGYNSLSNSKRRKTSHPSGFGIGAGNDTGFVPDLGEMGMDINEFAIGDMNGGAIDDINNNLTRNANDDILGTFEGDIDDLIRSQGGVS